VVNYLLEGEKLFALLTRYAATRNADLSEMLKRYVDVTDCFATLICALTCMLSDQATKGVQDRVVADAFDFLYEARSLTLKSNVTVSYPLARRAYESYLLLELCTFDERFAEKWESGNIITNSTVRTELVKHLGASDDDRKLYQYFSLGTHPNRGAVLERIHGHGDKFVLGSIGSPHKAETFEHCAIGLHLWCWLVVCVTRFYYDELSIDVHLAYTNAYVDAVRLADEVLDWLWKEHKRLLEVERE
jgi:hypothetical protein